MSAILAYSRETTFFYAYFVARTVTAMVGETAVTCLALAYVVRTLQLLFNYFIS